MTTPGDSDGAAVSHNGPASIKPPADVDELRVDIAQTRAELGETVQALAAKVDVKARLQETADGAKARLREGLVEAPEKAQHLVERTGQAVRRNPVPYLVAAGAAAVIVLLVQWRRNSR